MKFSKIRNVKTPCRGTELAGGIDFFIPEYDDDFYYAFNLKNKSYSSFSTEGEGIKVHPFSRVIIPSGIKVNLMDKKLALVAMNKSGVCIRHGIDSIATLVDCDYQGEIHFGFSNPQDRMVTLSYGEKIIQFVLVPIIYDVPKEVKIEELYNEKTSRGEGGFGSTGIV